MVCDQLVLEHYTFNVGVLILVLMEYGLRHITFMNTKYLMDVLILVLMEYGLRLVISGQSMKDCVS